MADPRDSRGALVRRAVIADSPAIRRIRNAAIRDSLAIWTEREQDPDEAVAWLEPQIARGTALVAVERDEGGERDSGERVVGFAVASPWHPYEGYARTVEDSIYLSPTARGRGLGTRLLTAARPGVPGGGRPHHGRPDRIRPRRVQAPAREGGIRPRGHHPGRRAEARPDPRPHPHDPPTRPAMSAAAPRAHRAGLTPLPHSPGHPDAMTAAPGARPLR